MDWPKARAILLVAFTLVNLILAYSLWGPDGLFPHVATAPSERQVQQLKATLSDLGLELAAPVPDSPQAMSFLRVKYVSTLDFPVYQPEVSGRQAFPFGDSAPLPSDGPLDHPAPMINRETQAVEYHPGATFGAAMNLNLQDRNSVRAAVTRYLVAEQILPAGAQFSAIYPKTGTDHLIVEYVPMFGLYPVFSGYVRAEVSSRGVESVSVYWVQSQQYSPVPAKSVRPAAEALLRLAGRLQRSNKEKRTITDIRLGFYAGRMLTPLQPNLVNGWDTVPVWRIILDDGEVFYINAFNGELES